MLALMVSRPFVCMCKTIPMILEFATSKFNHSVQLSQFPSLWERALIRLLSRYRTSPSDVGPIANLSVLSKIFERIIHK